MRKNVLAFSCCALLSLMVMAQRSEYLLEKNWKFMKLSLIHISEPTRP